MIDLDKFRKRIKERDISISIVGFGYIGTCIGAVLANKGFRVVGIDPYAPISEEINQGFTSINEPGLSELVKKAVDSGNLEATTKFETIASSKSEVIIVTVGTPLNEDYSPNNDQIKSAINSMCPFLTENQLIMLKSTAPPNTTRKVVFPLIEQNTNLEKIYLSFCPERLAEGNAIEEFNSLPVVIGGVDEVSGTLSSIFWQEALEVETLLLGNSTAAELVKLADNLWIDLNIALANELALLSDKLDVDSLEVISAANSLPKGQHYVNILYPSLGVGGYCLTKDPWFVYHMGKEFGLELKTPYTSRTINDTMPEYTFNLLTKELEKTGRTLSQSKIAILGISFKNNTGDCRFTPTKPIIESLIKSGCELRIYDPWVSKKDAESVTTIPLSKSIDDAIKGADCVAYFAGHDEFVDYPLNNLAKNCKENAVVIDGRMFFSIEKISEIRSLGLRYKGIGR